MFTTEGTGVNGLGQREDLRLHAGQRRQRGIARPQSVQQRLVDHLCDVGQPGNCQLDSGESRGEAEVRLRGELAEHRAQTDQRLEGVADARPEGGCVHDVSQAARVLDGVVKQ